MSEDDGTTKSTNTRWSYTNDIVALGISATFYGVWGYSKVSGFDIGGNADLAAVIGLLLALTWNFGRETFETVKGVLGR